MESAQLTTTLWINLYARKPSIPLSRPSSFSPPSTSFIERQHMLCPLYTPCSKNRSCSVYPTVICGQKLYSYLNCYSSSIKAINIVHRAATLPLDQKEQYSRHYANKVGIISFEDEPSQVNALQAGKQHLFVIQLFLSTLLETCFAVSCIL